MTKSRKPAPPAADVERVTVGGPHAGQRVKVGPQHGAVLVVGSNLVPTAFGTVSEPHYRLDHETGTLAWVER